MKRFLKRVLTFFQSWRASVKQRADQRRFEDQIQPFSMPYRLHLGSGHVKFRDWVNVDFLYAEGVTDVVWDLCHPFPLADGSCSRIYSEHVVEHLTVDQGLALFREAHRLLQDQGVMRCAMPSLDELLDKSSSGDWRDQDWLTWPKYSFVKTRAEMLNIAFRWWGHQWLYDREELHRRLREAGFSKIRDVTWGESELSDLRNLETRKDSLLICEAEK